MISGGRAGVTVAGRVAAVLALASAGVHATAVDTGSLTSLAMAGMALACLPCAWHLWRCPTGAVWGMTAALDAAMLGVHAQMLAGASAGHVHAGGSTPGTVMWLGLGLVAAQLLLAGTTALRR